MKKYFYFMFVALFATMSLALTSCGDDDDEPGAGGSTGKYELTIDGQKVKFSDAIPAVAGNTYNCLLFNSNDQLNLNINKWANVEKGTALTSSYLTVNWDKSGKSGFTGSPVSDTSIKVTEKTSKTITISFTNAQIKEWTGDNTIVINGTITLPTSL